MPPQYSGKERNVLNQQGQVVEVKPRSPTPEEVQAAEKAKVAINSALSHVRHDVEEYAPEALRIGACK